MSSHEVSVCLAAFNGSAYIAEQIESILAQLDNEDELVIVDDNSTDATIEIINSFMRRNSNIKIINNKKNVGVVRSFEKGILGASSDIIVLCDQDDIWNQNKLTAIKLAFVDPKVSGFLSNASVFGSRIVDERLFFPQNYIPPFSIFDQFIRNDFIGCCLAFRKSKVSEAFPFPTFISMHDWWIGVNCIKTGKVVYDPQPLIKYRRHNFNLSPSARRAWGRIINARMRDALALGILVYRSHFKEKRAPVSGSYNKEK